MENKPSLYFHLYKNHSLPFPHFQIFIQKRPPLNVMNFYPNFFKIKGKEIQTNDVLYLNYGL